MSISSAVSASPEKASTTSYGELVRSTGISDALLELSGAGRLEGQEHRPEQRLDLDRRRRSPSPNSESVLIRKVTLTWPSSSSTFSTLPTRTPAIRTSSLGLSPPASVKLA